jgi:hypothetical protein
MRDVLAHLDWPDATVSEKVRFAQALARLALRDRVRELRGDEARLMVGVAVWALGGAT